MIPERKKLILQLILAGFVFGAIIGIEQIFYKQGIPDTFDKAPYQKNALLRFIMRALVWGGGVTPNITLILVYSAIYGQRHRSFFHLVYFNAQYLIITIARPLYGQPRPYQQDPYVYQEKPTSEPDQYGWYAYTCQASYGLPSGHALSCMALSVYVALDFILARRVEINTPIYKVDDYGQLIKVDSKITPKLNLMQKTLVISLAIIYSAVVGLARWIEKADTLNQILFGWALGVWLAVIFAVFVRDRLFLHVKQILEVQTEKTYFKTLIIVFIVNLALLSVSAIIYFLQIQHQSTPQYRSYIANLQILIDNNTNCSQVKNPQIQLSGADLYQTSQFIGLTSGYAGVVYQRWKFDGQTGFDVYQFDTFLFKFLRFCGRILVNGLLLVSVYLLLATPLQVSSYEQNLAAWYFLDGIIPNLFGYFFLFAFADSLCLKLKLFAPSRQLQEDDRTSFSTANTYVSQNFFSQQRRTQERINSNAKSSQGSAVGSLDSSQGFSVQSYGNLESIGVLK